MLREELLRFFAWDYCAAYIAHKLENDTGHRLDDMQKHGATEGLLWIEISEEFLRADMLGAFSIRTIRDSLAKMERPGVIVRAKERAGRISRILYNYQLVDQCVTTGIDINSLPTADPGRIAGVEPSLKTLPDPGESTGKIAGDSSGVDGGVLRDKVLREEKEENTSPTPSNLQSQNQPLPSNMLDVDDDGNPVEPQPKFKRKVWGKPKPDKPHGNSDAQKRLREQNHATYLEAAASVADLMPTRRMSSGTPTVAIAPGASLAAVLPDEVTVWNEVVTSGFPVSVFLWEMAEGRFLAKCREHPQFTAENWRKICEAVQTILKGGNERAKFLGNFQWLTKSNDNWWGVFTGKYQHLADDPSKKAGKPAPKVSGEDWQVAKARRIAREKEEAERAASTKVST